MAKIRKKSVIEIERTPIENFFMAVRDFVKENNRKVVIFLVAIIAVIAIALTVYVLISRASEREMIRFEAILEDYRSDPLNQEVKNRVSNDLRGLISDTKFGFVHGMSYYFLGNILFSDKKYSEAYSMFDAFIKKSSDKKVFIPVAVNKAAVCLEEQGKVDEAISLLSKFEQNNTESIILDQVTYNLGRLYMIKNDQFKAREYFNKVITNFPDSMFAVRSRERLMLISAVK